MKDGIASHTARSVAARRLTFERAPADYGDPAADIALSADVAAGLESAPGRMNDYVRARTAFFDQVVVRAINAGVRQVVTGAAGYDGRSLRYARPGVRWFEVDHPATQADKLERLARLGIDAAHVRFVAADFTADPVAARLREAGLDARRPALFLFEGIAVYLDNAVTEAVLAQFREVTVPGSLLAISVSLTTDGPPSAARTAFRERVAKLGEEARSFLPAEEAEALLARAGWQVAQPAAAGGPEEEARQASRRARGLWTARAVSRPARVDRPAQAEETAPGDGEARADGTAGARPGRARPGGAATGERDLPLYALLSRALVAFTIEADNEAEHQLPNRTTSYGRSPGSPGDSPWLISLAMWASGLRDVPDGGITVAALRQAARTGSNLAGLRRWGYLTFDPEPARGRQPAADTVLRLTAPGRAARDGIGEIAAAVEERWAGRFGADALAALRSGLAAIAAQLPAGLPDSLPILGPGLFSRAPENLAGDGGAQVAGLPLWALLSRVLLAFAADFEAASPVSLAICADVLRVLTPAGVRSRDIPGLSGVSKEAVAMAMGILVKRGLVTEGKDLAGGRWRIARLTPRGGVAQAAYHEIVADIEDAWQMRFGAPAVDALHCALAALPLESLLEGAGPYPGGWRARVAPPALLPHYPMVLHRGGYPDGS